MKRQPYFGSAMRRRAALAAAGFTYGLAGAAVSDLARRKKMAKMSARKSRKGRTYRKKGGSAVSYGFPTVKLTKRKRTVRQDYSNDVHQINLTQPSRNPSAMQLAKVSLEDQWYRVQGLSQVDTSVGFVPCASRINSSGARALPVHVWDITASPQLVAGVATRPLAGYALMQLPTGECSAYSPFSQADGGGTLTHSQWDYESTSGNEQGFPYRKAFHYWTQIKLNLYGVRKRSTRWMVQLIMLKDTSADFINAASTNLEKKKVYDYLARPLMYNNLNSSDPQTKADIKILKSYECILGPITTDEYGGNTSNPHIQTLNWFIKHNRVRRYDWKRDTPPPLDPNAAWDEDVAAGRDTRVDPKYRVYLVIRALSPERRTIDDFNADADPISEPSYDYVIRNKFGNPA